MNTDNKDIKGADKLQKFVEEHKHLFDNDIPETLWDILSTGIPEDDYDEAEGIAKLVAGKSIMYKEDFIKAVSFFQTQLPSNEQEGVEDLQDQVRKHIAADNLFDWHEALTENEMILLEQLLLTFFPLCPPGSIGFEKGKKFYGQSTQPKETENLKAELEGTKEIARARGDAINELNEKIEWMQKENERLRLDNNSLCFAIDKIKQQNNL